MSIEKYTIDYLFKTGVISVRAFNVCKYNNIYTLQDICNYFSEKGSFDAFRNCGRKTNLELIDICNKYIDIFNINISNSLDSCLNDCISLYKNASLEIIKDDYLGSLFMSTYNNPEKFVKSLFSDTSIFCIPSATKSNDIISIWNLSIQIIDRMILLTNDSQQYSKKQLLEIKQNIESSFYLNKIRMILSHLNEKQDSILQAEYRKKLQTTPVRAKNVLHKAGFDYKSIVNFILADDSIIYKVSSCGPKTLSEIKKLFQGYIKFIESLPNYEKEDIDALEITQSFPFLMKEEINWVNDFYQRTKKYPMFYIAMKYFSNSKNRDEKLFAAYKGIGCEPNKNIGQEYGLTSERTRQICSTMPDVLRNEKLFLIHNWQHYSITNKDYIIANEELNVMCQHEFFQISDIDYNSFASIIEIVFKWHRIDFNNKAFLFSENLYKAFDFKASFADINKNITARCANDIQIPISVFIDNYLKSSINFDLKYIYDCTKYICQNIFMLDVDNSYNCLIKQNYIDVKNEAYKIIEKNGRPMHLKEIFSAFKTKFPNHKYTSPEQMRTHLINAENIKSLGKTSTYVIDKWNFKTEGIRDLAYDILKNSSRPLKLKEIVCAIENKSRSTTENSLNSTILLDTKGRFVKFKGGYIGISGKEYDDDYIQLTESDLQRFSFEERLEMFTAFIDDYHYSPQSGGNEEEQSLIRWYNNVIRGYITLTKEQRNLFDAEIEKRKIYFYTGIEYNFMKKCDEYKLFVNNNYELPNYITDLQLFTWFNKNRKIYINFSDKRKKLFEDLLIFLSDFGYSID